MAAAPAAPAAPADWQQPETPRVQAEALCIPAAFLQVLQPQPGSLYAPADIRMVELLSRPNWMRYAGPSFTQETDGLLSLLFQGFSFPATASVPSSNPVVSAPVSDAAAALDSCILSSDLSTGDDPLRLSLEEWGPASDWLWCFAVQQQGRSDFLDKVVSGLFHCVDSEGQIKAV